MKELRDIIEDFAQKVVDDMDMNEMMDSVKQSIIERLEAEEESDVINEIEESVYSEEVLQDYVATLK